MIHTYTARTKVHVCTPTNKQTQIHMHIHTPAHTLAIHAEIHLKTIKDTVS